MNIYVRPVVFTPLVDLLSLFELEVVGDRDEEILLGAVVLHTTDEDGEKTWLYNIRLQTLAFALTGVPFAQAKEQLECADRNIEAAMTAVMKKRYLTVGEEMYVPAEGLMQLFDCWTEALDFPPVYSAQTLHEAMLMGETQADQPHVHDAGQVH